MKKIITPVVVLSLSALFAYSLGGRSRQFQGIPLVWILVTYSLMVQVISAIPAIKSNTQKYYDLTGSLTFISITIIATLTNKEIHLKQAIAACLVIIWAGRLGYFLFSRISKSHQDSRFIEIKKSKIRFLYAWLIQGLWVVITMGPLLAIMTSESVDKPYLNLLQYSGIAIWAAGLVVQICSDEQKSNFNSKPQNKGKFISVGLWKYSRHPNYVGQITLWIGATLYAISSLSGGQYVTLICPLFVYLLISKVSGVPLLQKKADEVWGSDEQYRSYKQSTPILFPTPFRPSRKLKQ